MNDLQSIWMYLAFSFCPNLSGWDVSSAVAVGSSKRLPRMQIFCESGVPATWQKTPSAR